MKVAYGIADWSSAFQSFIWWSMAFEWLPGVEKKEENNVSILYLVEYGF